MITKERIAQNVKIKKAVVEQFLGYKNRPVPPVIEKKINEELEKFDELLQIEYGFHYSETEHYADIIYTVGEEFEKRINQYIASSDTMRAMVLDKIAIVALDEIKEEIQNLLYEKYKLVCKKEIYPGSKDFPIEKQKEILEKNKVATIRINEYHQLHPVKSVALRLLLSEEANFHNRCNECVKKCDAQLSDEEAAYRFFVKKAQTSTKEKYEQEGLSDELFQDNIKDIEIWAKHYEKQHGVKGIAKEHHGWINSILNLEVIKLGRLQFALLESPLDERLQPFADEQTIFLNVHIREGEDFSKTHCIKSYRLAEEYYKKQYSFSKIAFVCDSWLLHPKLAQLLPKQSNILDFAKDYRVLDEQDNRQMEERVFKYLLPDAKDYPENTHLQIALKKELLQGNSYGSAIGIYLVECDHQKSPSL